jgi:hypothetical protein
MAIPVSLFHQAAHTSPADCVLLCNRSQRQSGATILDNLLPIDIQPRSADLTPFGLGPSHSGPNALDYQTLFEFGDCADDHDNRPPQGSLSIDCFTLAKELNAESVQFIESLQ